MPLRVMSEPDGSERVEAEMLKVLPWLRISMATSAKRKYNVSKSKAGCSVLVGFDEV